MASSTTAPATPDRDPISPTLQKVTALAGIGYVVLLLAAFLFSGDEMPDRDAPLADWSAFAADNEENMRIGTIFVALAAYEFILFLGLLRSHLGRAEVAARGFTTGAYFVLIGGVIGIAGLTMGVAGDAAAVGYPDANPETIRSLSGLSGMAWTLAPPGFAAMLISTFILSRATRALPSWLTWVALAAGLFHLLELGVLLDKSQDNAFGASYPLAFLTTAIFVIGVSIVFFKRVGQSARTT